MAVQDSAFRERAAEGVVNFVGGVCESFEGGIDLCDSVRNHGSAQYQDIIDVENIWGIFIITHINFGRTFVTALVVVEHGKAETVERFWDGAKLVAWFSP